MEQTESGYSIGEVVLGEVLDVWQVGAHIGLPDGSEALLLNSELSWDGVVPDAQRVLRRGQPVSVQIVSVEPWRERIYVSLRRATHDPWKEHAPSYRKGAVARARVAQFARDEVVIEFEDFVNGFIPRDEISRSAVRAEDILEIGDWVEVKILEKIERSREVKASMKARLAEIEEEIGGPHGADAALASDASDDPAAAEERHEFGEKSTGQHFHHVLIAEDDPLQRLQLRAILADLGCRQIEEASSGPEAIEKAKTADPALDLVLMDQEMPAGNGDAGIHAAEKIKRQFPKTPIVLMTGNKPAWDAPDKAPEFLAGIVSKPFDYKGIGFALHRLHETGSVGWPAVWGVLAEEVPDGVEFLSRISRVAHAAGPLADILHNVLVELCNSTGARGAGIFGWNRSNKKVTMESAAGVRREDFERCREHLHKSPVADLVYQPEQSMFYRNIDKQAEGKFLYLRPILGQQGQDGRWPLQACIGEFVGEEFEELYTLFVFGDRVDPFKPDARVLTRAAAAVARAAIREHWIIRQVVSERRLMTLGGIVTSVAHELRGRLGALEVISSVERSWRRLRSNPEKLRDAEFAGEMESRIAGLQKSKQAMDAVVGKILGWVRTDEDSMVSVRSCIERAVAACNDLAVKSKIRVAIDLGFSPEVRANAVDLEQAFLNIVLNAIVHMKVPNRRAGLLTIQLRCEDQKSGPIQIRFRDTGPGIHSRYLDRSAWGEEKIFQPLFTTKKSGTGMGLYIVRGLLANHGATILVEKTAIWAGTTFLIEIPFRQSLKPI